MRFIVAVTLFAALLGVIESSLLKEKPILLENREICKEKSGVSADVLNKAIKNDIQDDDKQLQCYAKCMLEEVKVMDEKGAVDFTNFISTLLPKSQTTFGPIMIECQTVVDEAESCLKAMKIYLCLQEKTKEAYEFA